MKKALSLFILVTAAALTLTGCGAKAPANTVLSPDGLKGRTVGVLSDTAAASYVGSAGTLKAYTSGDAMIAEVKNGALDCAVEDEAMAKTAVKHLSRLKVLSQPLYAADFRFAVAKENADLRKDVNQALAQLTEDGTLRKITDVSCRGGNYRYLSPENADHSAGTLTLAVSASFPPYSYDDGNGRISGLDIDVARAVCDILHVGLSVTVTDKDNLLTAVQIGKADFAMGGITKNDGDGQLVDFSDPYTACRQVIIVRK